MALDPISLRALFLSAFLGETLINEFVAQPSRVVEFPHGAAIEDPVLPQILPAQQTFKGGVFSGNGQPEVLVLPMPRSKDMYLHAGLVAEAIHNLVEVRCMGIEHFVIGRIQALGGDAAYVTAHQQVCQKGSFLVRSH